MTAKGPDLKKLAESFQSPPSLWQRVAANRLSRERRRRIVAGGVGLLVALLGTVPLVLIVSAGHSDPADQAASAVSTPAGQPPNCPFDEEGSDPSVVPASGPPGSVVTVTVPIPNRDENDEYIAPSGSVDIWWNADPNNWPDVLPGGTEPTPVLPGSVLRLTSIDASGRCFAQGEITIPNAAPGIYNLLPVNADAVGAVMILPPDDVLTFEVTQ